MEKIVILGSTGSIGCNVLEVIKLHKEKYKVFALTANKNVDLLTQQCVDFEPEFVIALNQDANQQLKKNLLALNIKTVVLDDEKSLDWLASHKDTATVISAIVGAAGLMPTMAAANSGKKILLANKETLVMAGELFVKAVKKSNAILIPIDSEHNAILQVLPQSKKMNHRSNGIRKILLTASGGPFRTFSIEELKHVTPKEALKHPNWLMGKKITIDSATMMNKGLEIIEACWLFDIPACDIEVVIHPQSIIHSLVEYIDGSTLAQMGNPDMRTPIAYALSHPERIESGVSGLDLIKTKRLDFEAPDLDKFPCLGLAYKALLMGQSAPTILNAANEVAVDAFLVESITFNQIAELIEYCMSAMKPQPLDSIEIVLEVDSKTRQLALSWINSHNLTS
ncbi:1-deoxy-D-xylulose-5-phosphate reductoisomerase [Candidatus Methylopumilus planktonicus]|uniref:1-deoxy-D-xylulose-5-phosphate reductoisomerase n=1 Tax=Candidatus Methylopumilus planktonicus TaxID=1581557 RepID=UPI00112323E5|nr:1-deoxy-D-xylulose-5-phosphate reductoisomerase [Candidatus Methylopumilus planktonicus]QDD06952.1 1-deoxy-D-xylulose-5-phosphate reductoisomerase [Candidatus Methylopumilus planktonicus]QDD08285.1 1-deoxy-D-xylulose-5-phosphate reductoisomerase [Candidatus Methylopumilus planktonicus]QDD09613.1 1-deoxy-D-xylulose-5-phosphate reductoisomerase [Candidatus Methylopumilus planktonicus]